MTRESTVMRMIKNDYIALGLNIDDVYRKTDMLLNLYRKVHWSINAGIDELDRELESAFGDANLGNTYLLNFAPQKELAIFEERAENVLQTRQLLTLIEKATEKVSKYPIMGDMYYTILKCRYLEEERYNENNLLLNLEMERSTYYSKRKEAICLTGYILFGYVLPEFSAANQLD